MDVAGYTRGDSYAQNLQQLHAVSATVSPQTVTVVLQSRDMRSESNVVQRLTEVAPKVRSVIYLSDSEVGDVLDLALAGLGS